MNLEELRAEKTRCINMKSAVGALMSELTSFSKSFSNCSAHFNAGGLLIDGKPADAYTFGGFDKYVDNKIKPMINQLSSLSSALSAAIPQLDVQIKTLEEEERRKADLERKEKLSISGKKNVTDNGFYIKGTDKSNDKGFYKSTGVDLQYKGL